MKLNVNPDQFIELTRKGYTLDLIFLLKLIDEQMDISSLRRDSDKIDVLYQTLKRRGLISEFDEKVTLIGRDVLQYVDAKTTAKLVKRKPSTEFDEWWTTYPGTDTFEHEGKKFVGARSLRVSKDDCRVKFDKILLEGEYNATQLINALKLDIAQKKAMSLKTNTNKLSYMQNSLTYLNQRSFEPFIELSEKGEELTTITQTGGTDI